MMSQRYLLAGFGALLDVGNRAGQNWAWVQVSTRDLHPREHGSIPPPCPQRLLLQQSVSKENPKLEGRNHLRPKSEAAPGGRALRGPAFAIVMEQISSCTKLTLFSIQHSGL